MPTATGLHHSLHAFQPVACHLDTLHLRLQVDRLHSGTLSCLPIPPGAIHLLIPDELLPPLPDLLLAVRPIFLQNRIQFFRGRIVSLGLLVRGLAGVRFRPLFLVDIAKGDLVDKPMQ